VDCPHRQNRDLTGRVQAADRLARPADDTAVEIGLQTAERLAL
jgi:hypothetical protein